MVGELPQKVYGLQSSNPSLREVLGSHGGEIYGVFMIETP